jgi:hypothetical protein
LFTWMPERSETSTNVPLLAAGTVQRVGFGVTGSRGGIGSGVAAEHPIKQHDSKSAFLMRRPDTAAYVCGANRRTASLRVRARITTRG